MRALEATSVLLDAAELDIGSSRRTTCPACGHRTLSITRKPDGVLYHCFRVSCAYVDGGFIPTSGRLLPPELGPEDRLNPYDGETLQLTIADEVYFDKAYELERRVAVRYIRRSLDGRYALPVFGPAGLERGIILRQPWPGAPITRPEYPAGQPKAVAYWHAHGPRQAIYEHPTQRPRVRRLLLVEDQLSALKALESGLFRHTVALLGTGGSVKLGSLGGTDAIRELSMLRPQEVIVAFDKDATERGFKWARKWGLAFPKVRVAMLERDIKDTPLSDIADALGIEE